MRGTDVLQGIQAFSGMSRALQGDPHKDFYNYMLQRQKCVDDHYAAVAKAAQTGQQPPDPPACAISVMGSGGGGMGGMGGMGGYGGRGGYGGGYGAGGGGGYYGYPQTAQMSAGVPGMGPTVPGYAGGGAVGKPWDEVAHFQEGGGVDLQPPELPPYAAIVPNPVSPAAQQVNYQPPPMNPVDQAVFDIVNTSPVADDPHMAASDRAINEVRGRRQQNFERNIPAGEDTAPPTAPPAPAPATTSKFGRATEPVRSTAQALADRYTAQEDLASRRAGVQPGLFEQQTEQERAGTERALANINAGIGGARQLGGAVGSAINVAPAGPAAAPLASQAPAASGAPVPPPVVSQPAPNAGRPGTDLRGLDRYLAGPSAPPGYPGAVNFGPSGPAAPAGVAPVTPPQAAGSSTPGGLGASPTPPPVPGAIGDQTRTAAFDPTKERGAGLVNPDGTRAAPAQMQAVQTGPAASATGAAAADTERPGMLSSNEVMKDYHTALNGAQQGAVMALNAKHLTPAQVQSGAGALSPRATNAILTKYKGLPPGAAMVAGMTAVYKRALELGDMRMANNMAFAVVQRANLEAAINGKAAIAAIQKGDLHAGADFVSRGHEWVPDGATMKLAPDGNSVYVTDIAGKATQLPLDGRWVLAAANGLADGSLMWNMINQHAAMLSRSQVRDPEGQQLKHEQQRLNIQRTKQKIAGGAGGKAASPSLVGQLQAIFGGGERAPAQTVNVNVTRDDD